MIYCSKEWMELDKTELNDEILIVEFLKDTRKTIYVSSDEGILGIVTLGDFRRYKLKGTPLIRTSFSSFLESEEKLAEELLLNNRNIYSVPIVDTNGKIVKEYRKQFHAESMLYNDNILRSWVQFLPKDKNAQNLVLVKWEHASERESAKEIMSRISDKIVFAEADEIADELSFIKNSDYETIYDSVPEDFRIREVIYKEYHKNYVSISYHLDENFIESFFHFESIGILDRDMKVLRPYLKTLMRQSVNVIVLNEDKLQWNKEKGSYEYVGIMEQVPELLLVCYFLYNVVCCDYKDTFIPMISWFVCEGREISDYDMAYNVIPRLNKKGISTLVISNIADEVHEIEGYRQIEYDEQTIKKRIIEAFGIKESETEKRDAFEREWYGMTQVYCHHAYLRFRNNMGRYFNIFNGERLTIGNPKEYDHTCWIFGPCITWGSYVDDAHTIASFLRKKMSPKYYIRNIYAGFRVLNFIVRDYIFKRGDILIVYPHNPEIYRQAGIKTVSTVNAYKSCENIADHLIDNNMHHVDRFLMEKIADLIYESMRREQFPILDEAIISENTFGDRKVTSHGNAEEIVNESVCFGVGYKTDIPSQLSSWLGEVNRYRGMPFERTGAIVMNCNPFTLGHRYLIERACTQVDRLIIFVVEEDKSFFSFRDRIEMVRLGTADLKKVIVIPSGRYIISAQTLPGYFEKDDNPDIVFDATEDLDVFAEVIAEELNINVRFAGEEPLDNYTRQYNSAMSRILPSHGIDFVEIPRKEHAGSVISASRVRKLMVQKSYEEIKELVMPKVYVYLKEHYF